MVVILDRIRKAFRRGCLLHAAARAEAQAEEMRRLLANNDPGIATTILFKDFILAHLEDKAKRIRSEAEKLR